MAKEKDDYSLEEYLDYEVKLEEYMTSNSEQIVFNDSFVHAVMIVTSILNYAKKNNHNQVCMYCGKFSLFRDDARKKLECLRETLKPDDPNAPAYSKWEQFNPYKKLMESLKAYLNEGGLLSVIVENDISEIVGEDSWVTLHKYVEGKRILFRKVGVPLGLNHFMVAGKCYRRENNDLEKTALCCFNDEETSISLKKNFQVLSLLSDYYKI